MTQDNTYIAALEIGSSKIIGAVGVTRAPGHLEVLAVEQEKGVESVRFGHIQNLDETSTRIARVIDRLEQHPSVTPRRISALYIGLSGRSLRSIPATVSLNLADDTEITEDILERMKAEALKTAIDNTLTVVDAIPRTYQVGKATTQSPKGMVGNDITAIFDVIVCRHTLTRNIMRTITDKLGIRVQGFVVTALACGHLILSDEQKRLGCMLADIGAETTSVTLYSLGSLKYFATLPLGGRNITRDLTSLSMLEERAEDIKITSGNAIVRETSSTINLNGLRLSDISNVIVARSEEIVANIMEQLPYAGLTEKDVSGGIICIGGGARLQGMTELLGRQSGLQIHRGHLPDYVTVADQRATSFELIEVVSVLYAGATLGSGECLAEPHKEAIPITGEAPAPDEGPEKKTEPGVETPVKIKPGLMSSFKRRLSNLFAPPESDDSDLIDE